MAERRFIGALAKAVGLSTKAIRYYEGLGLLGQAQRTESGYREYGPEDEERLRFIRGAKALGLSLQEIKAVLDLWGGGVKPCAHVGSLLAQKLAQLDRKIEELSHFRAELAEYLHQVDANPLPDAPCAHIEGASRGVWTAVVPDMLQGLAAADS